MSVETTPTIDPKMLEEHTKTWLGFTTFVKIGAIGSTIVVLIALYFIV